MKLHGSIDWMGVPFQTAKPVGKKTPLRAYDQHEGVLLLSADDIRMLQQAVPSLQKADLVIIWLICC